MYKVSVRYAAHLVHHCEGEKFPHSWRWEALSSPGVVVKGPPDDLPLVVLGQNFPVLPQPLKRSGHWIHVKYFQICPNDDGVRPFIAQLQTFLISHLVFNPSLQWKVRKWLVRAQLYLTPGHRETSSGPKGNEFQVSPFLPLHLRQV